MKRRFWVTGAALMLLSLPLILRGQGRGRESFSEPQENVPYDGRFTFARIQYASGEAFSFRRREPEWSHDYPRAEIHFSKLLGELSTIVTRDDGSVILSLDDPALTRFPVAYMAEPGFWRPTEAEVLGLRNYLVKGGFLIFDDFAGQHWLNLEAQIRRVFPDATPLRLDPSHPIFNSFYSIESLEYYHPYYGMPSEFWAVFEENDPTKRMLMMINYNNDIAEYWEYSDTGMFPIDLSNEAYKLGINYLVYALTR